MKRGKILKELQLSHDLNIITAEIIGYQNMAGQSIFEIGKRLKHVKENDLVHGEWINWLKSINMDRTEAHRFMKVVEELGSNVGTYQHLGLRALSEISILPPEEREKEHTLPSGKTKTVDEMTVKELQEVKAALRKAEEENKKMQEEIEQAKRKVELAEKAERIAMNQLEELVNAEPETIEKEVVPEKVTKQIEKLKEDLRKRKETVEQYKAELEKLKNQKDYEANEKEKELELKYLQFETNKTPLTLKYNIDKFLKENSITVFRESAIAASTEITKAKLEQGIEELEAFCKAMRLALSGRIETN